MGRNARRHHPDARQPERAPRSLSHVQMSLMNRIEGAAEQPQSLHAGAASAAPATSRHMASSSAGTPSPVTAEMG